MKAFYVYMMTNPSRVVLYTGVTNSLMRRVWQHQNSEIERFTKTSKVNRFVYYEYSMIRETRSHVKRKSTAGIARRRTYWSKRRIRRGRIYLRCFFNISNLPRVLQQLKADDDDRRQFAHSVCFARSVASLGMTSPTM